MFRRRWSGLPPDPQFPSDLTELGYFVNEIDEIRSIANPDYYFKYFINKNERWNERQRFAFNEAVGKIIHERLTSLGLETLRLPLGTPPTEPHVPIRISSTLAQAKRVVLFFGESCQESGVLSHRVIGRRGGINKGSLVSLVQGLKKQQAEDGKKDEELGIVLANLGELWWWPEGKRGLTPRGRHGVPMASCVHLGRWHDKKVNEIPLNRSPAQHVKCVFESVVLGGEEGKKVPDDAMLDIIAVGDGADEVEKYLDQEEVWAKIGDRLNSFVNLNGNYSATKLTCNGFKKFMEDRARAYMMHNSPLGTPLAGPAGNPGMLGFTTYGCPVYSAGPTVLYVETMLIEIMPAVLEWICQVAREGKNYKNEEVHVYGDEVPKEDDITWANWSEDKMWGETMDDSNVDVEKLGDMVAKVVTEKEGLSATEGW